jgi:titin
MGCSLFAISNVVSTPGAPAAPSNLVGEAQSPTSIELTWTDNSTGEENFHLQRRMRNLDRTYTGYYDVLPRPAANATTTMDNIGLAEGRQYQYRIQACNSAGCSAFVVSMLVTTPVTATPPDGDATGASAVQTSATSIMINWNDNSSNEADFQLLRRKKNTDGSLGAYAEIARPGMNAFSYTDTGLTTGESWQYKVRACNIAGCSAFSSTAVVKVEGIPATPTNLGGSAPNSSTVNVTWTDASSNENIFNLARRIRNSDGSFTPYVVVASPPQNATLYVDGGRTSGVTYSYKIRACNAAGCSPYVGGLLVTVP